MAASAFYKAEGREGGDFMERKAVAGAITGAIFCYLGGIAAYFLPFEYGYGPQVVVAVAGFSFGWLFLGARKVRT
jgi:hypothetical protein